MKTSVIGSPKTIDGDLKCKEVPTSFGFDTACKVILAMQLSFTLPMCIIIVLDVIILGQIIFTEN